VVSHGFEDMYFDCHLRQNHSYKSEIFANNTRLEGLHFVDFHNLVWDNTMLTILDDYNTLNDWVISVLRQNQVKWSAFLEDNFEIASYIEKNRISDYYAIKHSDIHLRVLYCLDLWRCYEQPFDLLMMSLFGIKEPINAVGYITFFPLFPRDIETHIFLIPFIESDIITLSIIAHEQIHFYFYSSLAFYRDSIHEISDDMIWLISELMIPLLFEYMDQCSFMKNLVCSGYCFSELQKNKIKPIFNKYFISERNIPLFIFQANSFLS
jgi:hypothetical protein